MNEIINISNVRGRINKDANPELNLEDVAKGLGFIQRQNKNGKIYESIRWERIRTYFDEFGIPPLVGEDVLPEYIAENIFYKLCFKASNETARAFQDIVTDEVLPAIRKYGAYLTPAKIEEVLSDPDTIIRIATALKEEKEKRLLAENQVEKLAIQLDESKHWYTIKRVAHLNRIDWKSLDWRMLKNQSQLMRLKVDKVFDPNFGTVNSYHEDVWKAVYPKLVY